MPKELVLFLISSYSQNPMAEPNKWEPMVSCNQGEIHQKDYNHSVDQKLHEAKKMLKCLGRPHRSISDPFYFDGLGSW